MLSSSKALSMQASISAEDLSRLRWRARRGLLECDLFVQRFFEHHAQTLTSEQAEGFRVLMALDDPDLLDLLLRRAEPEDALARDDVRAVLNLMRVN